MRSPFVARLLILLVLSFGYSFTAYSQCTVSGTGTINFTDIICAETGSAPVAGDQIIIPFGVTVTTSLNGQNLGSFDVLIEDGGVFLIDHNNISLDGNIIIESGGLLQINGKIDLSAGSAISVEDGGQIFTGGSAGASDRLSIGGTTIIQGGGDCTVADGSADAEPPYCGGSGITGPTGFDETGEVPGVLPVVLISFDGTVQGNAVKLDWLTAAEERNAYFELENSYDGQEYSSVAQILGAGTTTALQSYSYVHTRPYTGISYYRLVQVDIDDTRTIYGPIRIDRAEIGELMLFPNPATPGENLTILRSTTEQDALKISLRDLQGRLLGEWNMNGNSEMGITIPANLELGVYVVEVTAGAQQKLYRLLLK